MKRRALAQTLEVVFSEVIKKNGHLWMGDGVVATLHSSNISKNKERYFFTEDVLRKAVIFDRILFHKLGRIQRERRKSLKVEEKL